MPAQCTAWAPARARQRLSLQSPDCSSRLKAVRVPGQVPDRQWCVSRGSCNPVTGSRRRDAPSGPSSQEGQVLPRAMMSPPRGGTPVGHVFVFTRSLVSGPGEGGAEGRAGGPSEGPHATRSARSFTYSVSVVRQTRPCRHPEAHSSPFPSSAHPRPQHFQTLGDSALLTQAQGHAAPSLCPD